MSPELLARKLEDFLVEAPHAAVVEDASVIFSLDESKYAITSKNGKCLLHLWSAERNIVRRVLDAELKNGTLRLAVQRFGQSKPHTLEICRDRDLRTPSAKKSARTDYLRVLQRALERDHVGWQIERGKLTSAADLEHSFGPVYARGLLRKGRSACAVLGVNASETQASIDAALTFGLLWLELCRQRHALTHAVEGLKLFLPAGTGAVVRARLAHLDQHAAKFELWELDELHDSAAQIDISDGGNIATRLVRCPEREQVLARFAGAVKRIRKFVPTAETVVISTAELSFRLHGLEFARARTTAAPGSFQQSQEVFFGAGAYEVRLDDDDVDNDHEARWMELMQRVSLSRRADGDHRDPLWRMQPERWLESSIVQDVTVIDSLLDDAFVYSQVPAFSASDRAMIDVLTLTRKGQLAVLELKADEDIHLPLQGLDYWARVHWHHQRGEFQRFGYFAGRELSQATPLLYLVAPALRVHPATDTLLKFVSKEIECTLVGVNEDWRNGVRIIFRKERRGRGKATE